MSRHVWTEVVFIHSLLIFIICHNMTEKQPIRVTISQAANLFGVSQKTIRRAISAGEVKYVVVRQIYKISFESLLKWSQNKTKIRNKFNNKGIGQYANQWKIKNTLFSPNPESIKDNKANKPDIEKK